MGRRGRLPPSGRFCRARVSSPRAVVKRVEFKGKVENGLDFSYEQGELRIRCSPSEALEIVMGERRTQEALVAPSYLGQGTGTHREEDLTQRRPVVATLVSPVEAATNVVQLRKDPTPPTVPDLPVAGGQGRVEPSGGDSAPPLGEPALLLPAVPAELRTVPKLRPVIEWLLAQGLTDAERITACLEAQRSSVRALAPVRDLRKRVEDILAVVQGAGPEPTEPQRA